MQWLLSGLTDSWFYLHNHSFRRQDDFHVLQGIHIPTNSVVTFFGVAFCAGRQGHTLPRPTKSGHMQNCKPGKNLQKQSDAAGKINQKSANVLFTLNTGDAALSWCNTNNRYKCHHFYSPSWFTCSRTFSRSTILMECSISPMTRRGLWSARVCQCFGSMVFHSWQTLGDQRLLYWQTVMIPFSGPSSFGKPKTSVKSCLTKSFCPDVLLRWS